MGCCFQKSHRRAECCCYCCASCGVFYHRWDEGELECDTVKNWCTFTTEIIISGVL